MPLSWFPTHRDSLCCAKPPSDMIGSWITVRSPRFGGRDVSYALSFGENYAGL